MSNSKGEWIWLAVLSSAAAIGLFMGWKIFWFLTDDAFIAFRYVSNSQLGLGYVWNPPPFLPVEGYTSFLWVVILDFVWTIGGWEPPQSANVIALVFSFGTMIVTAIMLMNLLADTSFRKWRMPMVAVLFVYLLLNRTFLAWTSSGLETALFTFLIVFWVYCLICIRQRKMQIGLAALAASLLALTRPDGLLFCATTVVITVMYTIDSTRKDSEDRIALLVYGLLPLLIVVAHISWRRWFYGEWLPNTYYAKVSTAWPEAGIRYTLSFILEYAIWFPLIVFCWYIIRKTRASISRYYCSGVRGRSWFAPAKDYLTAATSEHIGKFLVICTLIFHLSYYVIMVGGDHFEYRIFHYVVPLVFVGFLFCLEEMGVNPKTALALAILFLLVGLPVQWSHWSLTKHLDTRKETYKMFVPIADHWPRPVRWYARAFDSLQKWMIPRHVGMRHQEHKVFCKYLRKVYPPRSVGEGLPRKGFLILSTASVGVVSWVLPHVNIIDMLGLNDYVIARTPASVTGLRLMAHNRHPPKGYIESYQPNLFLTKDGWYIRQRAKPLTAERIRLLEMYWRRQVKSWKK